VHNDPEPPALPVVFVVLPPLAVPATPLAPKLLLDALPPAPPPLPVIVVTVKVPALTLEAAAAAPTV
jgi:hypothetical protein